MSPEQERLRRAYFSMDREARRRTDRPVLVHGRQADVAADPSSLPTIEFVRMRDSASGEMLFTVDYSDIDGPDVIAP